jgi:xanthine dehydrogenase accessory factor
MSQPLTTAAAALRLLAVRDRMESAFLWVATAEGPGAGRRLLGELGADGALTLTGTLGDAATDRAAADLGRRALAGDPDAPAGLHALPKGEAYLEVQRPAPELVIVGAGHVAQPLAEVGALLGMDVTVLDDRPEFATRERFPRAARVLRVDFADPFATVPIHAGSHVVLVTRGHRYDFEALRRLLGVEPAPAYLGMIGSRRRVRATFTKLLEEGVDAVRLGRVRAPLGLDIRAQTPAEIAVAVAAEIVLLRRGGTGAPLRDVEGILERFFPERTGSSTPVRSEEP